MPKVAVILPAAGRSSRFKDKEKKPFAALDGRAVWLRTAELFVNRPDVVQVMVVVSPDDMELVRRRFGANLAFMNVQVVQGGSERFESVANALAQVRDDAELVAIHDAVRPCVTDALVSSVFAKAAETGAAILAVPVSDTVKLVDEKKNITATKPRAGMWLAQTPQVFRRDWLAEAYADRAKHRDITDDAQLVEGAGHPVQVVEGAATNIKITTRHDLYLAEAILKSAPKPKTSGPVHPFGETEMWGGPGLK
ncbi:MAG: 2-C-methyl-D-erythritol 4-phosphate cytidylyltransferase [Gemmataceae bacterium]|nr:2-C-methyl-D-erythritol 4-phosphate cytidylyltransferase [Gemmataceae bacterium]